MRHVFAAPVLQLLRALSGAGYELHLGSMWSLAKIQKQNVGNVKQATLMAVVDTT